LNSQAIRRICKLLIPHSVTRAKTVKKAPCGHNLGTRRPTHYRRNLANCSGPTRSRPHTSNLSRSYAGQYQQRPAPAEGGVLKRHWWRYLQPRGLPPVLVKLPKAPSKHRKALERPSRLDCQHSLEKGHGWDGGLPLRRRAGLGRSQPVPVPSLRSKLEPKMAAPEPGTIAVLAEKPYGLVYLLHRR
jgi:hypothetical protein